MTTKYQKAKTRAGQLLASQRQMRKQMRGMSFWVSAADRLPKEEGWYAVMVSDPDGIGWDTSCWWRAEFRKDLNTGELGWHSCSPVDDGQPVAFWMSIKAPLK